MMKKLLLFFVVAVLSTTYINAQSQSLSLSWDGNNLADTVMVMVEPNGEEATVFHAIVTNNSDNIVNVKVLRTSVDVLENTVNSFCFANQCYPPFTDESDYLPIPAGGSSPDDDFKGEFTANGAIGISIVKYKFFNINNDEDFVEVVIKYNSSPEAIDESIAKNINISEVYPNPAKQSVSLDYSFEVNVDAASVKIVNLLGSVVKEVEMNQNAGKLSIDISDLNNGVYFYTVVVNNEVLKTKKLVIR
jgi:hypothetical protein